MIDRREKLLEPGAFCLDLDAAPGQLPADMAPSRSSIDMVDQP